MIQLLFFWKKLKNQTSNKYFFGLNFKVFDVFFSRISTISLSWIENLFCLILDFLNLNGDLNIEWNVSLLDGIPINMMNYSLEEFQLYWYKYRLEMKIDLETNFFSDWSVTIKRWNSIQYLKNHFILITKNDSVQDKGSIPFG